MPSLRARSAQSHPFMSRFGHWGCAVGQAPATSSRNSLTEKAEQWRWRCIHVGGFARSSLSRPNAGQATPYLTESHSCFRIFATRYANCATRPCSHWSPLSRWPWALAPTPPSSHCSTRRCCASCRSAILSSWYGCSTPDRTRDESAPTAETRTPTSPTRCTRTSATKTEYSTGCWRISRPASGCNGTTRATWFRARSFPAITSMCWE